MEIKLTVTLPPSKYAKRFAFLLCCGDCHTTFQELGGNAYTAERALQKVRQKDEPCPVCGSRNWRKIRRIETENNS